MITVNGAILQRRDTTESWEYTNPILPDGQLGWERDIYGEPIGVKMGDGVTHWVDLEYWFNGPAQTKITITAGVTSTPLTIPFVGDGFASYILKRASDNSFDNNTTVTYDGANFVLYGADDGTGHFADSYIFGIRP